MKLTKSKQLLADAIHASGKGWPDGANWDAQDKTDGKCQDKAIGFYSGTDKPVKPKMVPMWRCGTINSVFMGYRHSIKHEYLSPNWHQCVLSREEYFSAYPAEPLDDADGWIEWGGGACPVPESSRIDITMSNGKIHYDTDTMWGWDAKELKITKYRLHKPEVKSTAVGDDETNLAAKEELLALESSESPEERAKPAYIYRPSIEQLMQTYADRAHSLKLANEHLEWCAKQASDAMNALSAACKDAGFDILPITEKKEPDLLITDWRDLKIGDVVEVPESSSFSLSGCCGAVVLLAQCDDANQPIKVDFGELEIWVKDWRFIRRP